MSAFFLLDFLFPRRCLGCGRWGRYFCEDCLKTIKPFKKQICPVCGKPAISGKTHALCQTKYSLDGLISIFPYEGAIKEAITKLKYKFVTDLAEELVALIVQIIKESDSKRFNLLKRMIKRNRADEGDESVLVPVPLHPRRERWRGFNQAEFLGRMLAEKSNWQVQTDILVRRRYTKPQVKLKGKKRKKNVKGAFEISPKVSHFSFLASNFLIFDDVWTTGSTLKECGNVLKRAKVKKVWGLTLAR